MKMFLIDYSNYFFYLSQYIFEKVRKPKIESTSIISGIETKNQEQFGLWLTFETKGLAKKFQSRGSESS